MSELFKYDLVASNNLFDSEGFMTDPKKRLLAVELEKNLSAETYITPHQWPNIPNSYIVDVMAYARKVPLQSHKTFGDFSNQFFSMVLSMCGNASRIDFVFDS